MVGEALRSSRPLYRWLLLVAILCWYLVASAFADPRGHLLTDVGGKSATVAAMVERGDWRTDLGYWAESEDPEGLAHPFAHTAKTPAGWWVNTTSLPLVLAARPLWALGGPRAALILPMLGALATAALAGRLERSIVGGTGLKSTLVVGVASPIAVYALDLWEHSIATALVLVGVLMVDGGPDRSSRAELALGGVAFGLAAAMRQEALVYATVIIVLAASCGRAPASRAVAVRRSGFVALSFGATIALTALAESVYYGAPLRAARAGGTASALGADLSERARVALVTGFATFSSDEVASIGAGVVTVGVIVVAISSAKGSLARRAAAAALCILCLATIVRTVRFGVGFVPGMVGAAPLVVAGAVGGIDERRWFLTGAALLPIPLIWAVQFTDGSLVQWGGRYLLPSCVVLMVLGITHLGGREPLLLGLLASWSLALTVVGVVWFVQRSAGVAGDMERVEALIDEDVAVWYDPVMARESGAFAVGEQWISTHGGASTGEVGDILTGKEIDRFVFIAPSAERRAAVAGFAPTGPGVLVGEFTGLVAVPYGRSPVDGEADQAAAMDADR